MKGKALSKSDFDRCPTLLVCSVAAVLSAPNPTFKKLHSTTLCATRRVLQGLDQQESQEAAVENAYVRAAHPALSPVQRGTRGNRPTHGDAAAALTNALLTMTRFSFNLSCVRVTMRSH